VFQKKRRPKSAATRHILLTYGEYMKIFSDKPLNIKETWINSFKLYNQSLTSVLPSAVALGVATVSVALIWHKYIMPSLATKNIDNSKIIYSVLSIVFSLVSIYLSGVILHRMYLIATDGAQLSIKESFKFIWQKYQKILVTVFLSHTICLVGYFLFILPGIFLTTVFIFVQPLIILEDQKILATFKKSFKMVFMNWRNTFAVIVPLILLNFVVTLATQAALPGNLWWLGVVIIGLFIVFYTLLLQALVLTQFNNLKLLKATER